MFAPFLAWRVRWLTPWLKRHGPQLAQLVLPNLCALCGNLSRSTLCPSCAETHWNEARLRCLVCALPLAVRHTLAGHIQPTRPAQLNRCTGCAERTSTPLPFDATFTLGDYRAPLDALALGLKFRARIRLASEFARQFAHLTLNLPEAQRQFDVIAPVPLSARRLVERGYNQAWEIARPLARMLHTRSDATLLKRVIHTAPQARLDPAARRLNVGGAFEVVKPVQGLHVVLVDDVMTTGATLEAIAHALKTAGAKRVTNLVALRTTKN
ncbi:ComF family protein [Paraburkholderia bonniea]|nr:ComF family protein [Paraburkholderia bonniea]WJF93304.1 ComF family protein [Paraburkholderia bonniea]